MPKSNFSSLIDYKKKQQSNEENGSNEKIAENEKADSGENEGELSESKKHSKALAGTLRRTYKIQEFHDKAIKIMSKFMDQGTEEEIVLEIFDYYFKNSQNGIKAVEFVEMLNK